MNGFLIIGQLYSVTAAQRGIRQSAKKNWGQWSTQEKNFMQRGQTLHRPQSWKELGARMDTQPSSRECRSAVEWGLLKNACLWGGSKNVKEVWEERGEGSRDAVAWDSSPGIPSWEPWKAMKEIMGSELRHRDSVWITDSREQEKSREDWSELKGCSNW
jgi:hypothetical protein